MGAAPGSEAKVRLASHQFLCRCAFSAPGSPRRPHVAFSCHVSLSPPVCDTVYVPPCLSCPWCFSLSTGQWLCSASHRVGLSGVFLWLGRGHRFLGRTPPKGRAPLSAPHRGHGGRTSWGLVIESFGEGSSPAKLPFFCVISFLAEILGGQRKS